MKKIAYLNIVLVSMLFCNFFRSVPAFANEYCAGKKPAYEFCDYKTHCKYFLCKSEESTEPFSCVGNPGFRLAFSNIPCTPVDFCNLKNDFIKCKCYIRDLHYPQVCRR